MHHAPFGAMSKAPSKSDTMTLPSFGGPAAPPGSCISCQLRRMLSGFRSERMVN